MTTGRKPTIWMGSSLDDLSAFPEEVKFEMGFALHLAQMGGKHESAKPLRGFGGGSILEVVSDFDGDTFRAVYTVKFQDAVYVLHAFQKKSKRGIGTPKQDMELIRRRLKAAEAHFREWSKSNGK
ncbi:MAG: type II toxin-antitoxin system RelE/ParE family toxin [candidate division Zixibacteria bacterium]|nr:type II toxin-antitoxin system RelE/ParE family toxin [candidate division Zixibacteria bacterium]